MIEIGVQSKNVVFDENPAQGFQLLHDTGFTCCDFSLNDYLTNKSLYQFELNGFFNKTVSEIEEYFRPHKEGAEKAGIRINQMHMPYPNYVPSAPDALNDYLRDQMAPKSIEICAYLGCHNIVVHGMKLVKFYGTEEKEWAKTEEFLHSIAPMAKEMNITICIENLYSSLGDHMVEGPCCNARKASERIDRFNDQYGTEVLGFCFDTGHANLVGIDFEDFLITLGKRLKVLHIHDNDGVTDLHQVPFTFTRTRENRPSTDWDGFIRGLKTIGFQDVLSFETAPVLQSFPVEMKDTALELIQKTGEYFKYKIEA